MFKCEIEHEQLPWHTTQKKKVEHIDISGNIDIILFFIGFKLFIIGKYVFIELIWVCSWVISICMSVISCLKTCFIKKQRIQGLHLVSSKQDK